MRNRGLMGFGRGSSPQRSVSTQTSRRRAPSWGLGLILMLACGDGGSGDTTSAGDSSGPGPCEPKECQTAADCCRDELPGPLAPGCPGNKYPNNWSCVSGECVHGGCDVNGSDCDIVPGMTCLSIAGTGQCVVPCNNDTDCETIGHMKGAECITTAPPNPVSYCVQPLP
jgi:hypothetical protein